MKVISESHNSPSSWVSAEFTFHFNLLSIFDKKNTILYKDVVGVYLKGSVPEYHLWHKQVLSHECFIYQLRSTILWMNALLPLLNRMVCFYVTRHFFVGNAIMKAWSSGRSTYYIIWYFLHHEVISSISSYFFFIWYDFQV